MAIVPAALDQCAGVDPQPSHSPITPLRHDGLPISTRLLCQAHEILLDNERGKQKMPGEIRRSQNWIGGTRPGNAVHVPPPHTEVGELLGQMENYIHQPPYPHSHLWYASR